MWHMGVAAQDMWNLLGIQGLNVCVPCIGRRGSQTTGLSAVQAVLLLHCHLSPDSYSALLASLNVAVVHSLFTRVHTDLFPACLQCVSLVLHLILGPRFDLNFAIKFHVTEHTHNIHH